ncbi:hypothetical protein [Tardiphaga sp. 813_E8_N1_3]|uniref:hypothetical protein n=1 Tax=Tardiphaga sp. 813_E8_N1_3 TaxID=3240760 RepID=UPI003F27BFAD
MSINRRHIIEQSIAEHGAPVVVPEDQIPLGKTLQSWEPGLPFIPGAVMRLGDWWYVCGAASATQAPNAIEKPRKRGD